MAFGTPALRVANANKTSSTTHSSTTTSDIAAGDYIFVGTGADNTATTDGTGHNEVSSVSVGGVSLTKAIEQVDANGAAAAGHVTSVWYGVTASLISSGATVTVTYASAKTAKVFFCYSGTRDTSKTLTLVGTDSAAETSAGGSDCPSDTTSGLTSAEHLHVKALSTETTTYTFTATSGYTAIAGTNTAGGSADTNISLKGEWDIATDTGSTSNPTSNRGNGAEWSSAFMSLEEVAGGGGTPHTVSEDDVFGLTDALTFTRSLVRAETFALTDARVFGRSIVRAETFNLTDARTVSLGIIRSRDDGFGLMDSIAAFRGIPVALADGLSLTDATTQATGKGASVADGFALTDARVLAQGKSLADAFALTDARSFVRAVNLLFADGLALTDLQRFSRILALADAFGLADAITPLLVGPPPAVTPGSVAVADSSTVAVALADTVGAAVSAADVQGNGAAVTDTTASDAAVATVTGAETTVVDVVP